MQGTAVGSYGSAGTSKPAPKARSPARRGFRRRAPDRWSGAAHAHGLAIARTLHRVADFAVHEREQRVIAAHPDVGTGVHTGAALAHDDRTGRNLLAAIDLDAEHLRLRIAAVARRAAALLLCHVSNSR